jgi:hypothetical protein
MHFALCKEQQSAICWSNWMSAHNKTASFLQQESWLSSDMALKHHTRRRISREWVMSWEKKVSQTLKALESNDLPNEVAKWEKLPLLAVNWRAIRCSLRPSATKETMTFSVQHIWAESWHGTMLSWAQIIFSKNFRWKFKKTDEREKMFTVRLAGLSYQSSLVK